LPALIDLGQQFYNQLMRFIPSPIRFLGIALAMTVLTCGLAHAQTPAASTASDALPAQPATPQAKEPVEQRIEHIQVEDSGSVINEVRVGGETKSITVQPKGGMPTYQVAPDSGERSWKILGF
jgi:hypothetical protein